jgi:hypothetical protein
MIPDNYVKILAFICIASITGLSVSAQSFKRTTISLDGIWQIAEGDSVHIPEKFEHNIQVPGLVSLAKPEFKNAGPKVENRRSLKQSDPLRESFWYHRTFTINSPIPEVAILKIAKAKYGTKVFLNGREIGINWACFTPGYFNVKGALKRGENELIVRVGASRDALPPSIPDGFDFEKERYIPGIYDNVTLTLSGAPHIVRVQTVPDIIHKELQVQLTLDSTRKENSDISFIVQEAKSLKVVGSLDSSFKLSGNEGNNVINVRLPLKDCHLWSPEDPFLYHLLVKTEGDTKEVEFGMREFHFSNLTKNAVLNGKPYFLRGSNITIYRFFEDSACKNLPWDTTWVRKLFASFKQFHWNSLRFCIGFPPDFWYKIADEEGILIQNEFPVWYGPGKPPENKWPRELKAEELEKEYTSMIYEYWNHPSVVIWDGGNETVSGTTNETGKAIWAVRNVDLSNRPWDNSYESHRAPGDVYEVHPYHFINSNFKLKDIDTASPIPQQNGEIAHNFQDFPAIINEYGWLWLNRDGTPTTLTKQLYENLLGPNSTTEQRWHLYATYMAAETEFWRCHRKAAGVLIFTALGYSRPDGQTSDFFTDVAKLKYDNDILKYLPDAFSPIGIMLDEWGNTIECSKAHSFKILTINDLGKDWKGSVSLRILKNNKRILQKSTPLVIPAYGKRMITIICNTPELQGTYTVEAVLQDVDGKPVKSIREIPFIKK